MLAEPLDDDPDAIYAFDPGFVTERGAVLLRPGKEGRRQEPSRVAQDLEAAGVPVAGTVGGAGRGRGRRLHPARRTDPPRRPRLPDEHGGIEAVSDCCPTPRSSVFDLPSTPGVARAGCHAPALVALTAGCRSGRRLCAAASRGARTAPGGTRHRDRGRAGRRVSEHGHERARPRPPRRARAGRQPGHARENDGGGRRGARLRGQRAVAQGGTAGLPVSPCLFFAASCPSALGEPPGSPRPLHRSAPRTGGFAAASRCRSCATRREAAQAGTSGGPAAARGSSGHASSGARR